MSQTALEPDFQLWDSTWSALPADGVQLFTRGAPRNVHALRHRCYFEDLWPLIAPGTGKYLEIGSGRGTTSMYLASRGCDVTLVDYSPTGLAVARQNFAREGLPTPRTVLADARNTGLEPDTYDCIYSIGLLEHFDDPKPLLTEILRLLKPGGRLFTVIIPRLPTRAYYLAYALFAPWKLAPVLVPRAVSEPAKRLLGRTAMAAAPNRTELSGPAYLEMLPEDQVAEASWCYYCPYHEIYRGKTANRVILTPAYRLHHALRRRFATPSGRTSEAFAGAILLTVRKR